MTLPIAPLLTSQEAADVLRITVRTLSSLPIPRKRVGRCWRYVQSDIDVYLADRRAPTGTGPAVGRRLPARPRRSSTGLRTTDEIMVA